MKRDHLPTKGAWFFVAAALSVSGFFFYRWYGSPQIQLGNLSEGLGALFTFAAAAVALWIATRDRSDRIAERVDEQRAHARLVRVAVEADKHSRVTFSVRNYGSLPVLNVRFVRATLAGHPDARQKLSYGLGWGPETNRLEQVVLMPVKESGEDTALTLAAFVVNYLHPTEDRYLAEINPETANDRVPNYVPIDLDNVCGNISFSLADGSDWLAVTEGSQSLEPQRVNRRRA